MLAICHYNPAGGKFQQLFQQFAKDSALLLRYPGLRRVNAEGEELAPHLYSCIGGSLNASPGTSSSIAAAHSHRCSDSIWDSAQSLESWSP